MNNDEQIPGNNRIQERCKFYRLRYCFIIKFLYINYEMNKL